MEGSNSKKIPDEIQSFIERLNFLTCGTKHLDELIDYDFRTITLKIKFLGFDPGYKTTVINFLRSTALPIIDMAYELFDQIIGGISLKAKYGPLTGIKKLQLYGNEYSSESFQRDVPSEFKGYEPLMDEDIMYAKERFREELDYYTEHFKLLVSEQQMAQPPGISIVGKIKTNLSLEQLATFFKILNQYDEPKNAEKKVIPRHSVTKLCDTIAQSFSSKGSENINPGTLENRYHSGEQILAAEFWVDKFKSLHISATNLVQELISKEDKPKKRKINK